VGVLITDQTSHFRLLSAPEIEISCGSEKTGGKMEQGERFFNELNSEKRKMHRSIAAVPADSRIGTYRGRCEQTSLQAENSSMPAANRSHATDASASIDAASMDSVYYSGPYSHATYVDNKMRAALKGKKKPISSNMSMPSMKGKLQSRTPNTKKPDVPCSSATQTQTHPLNGAKPKNIRELHISPKMHLIPKADNSLSTSPLVVITLCYHRVGFPQVSPVETSATKDTQQVSTSDIHRGHDPILLNREEKQTNTNYSSHAVERDMFSEVSSEYDDADGDGDGDGDECFQDCSLKNADGDIN
jgi:hypothetical protein